MRRRDIAAIAVGGLMLWTTGGCSSSDEGCKSDNDCKGDRVCESGACVSPQSGGSGGGSSGGFGGSGASGGSSATGGGGSGGCPSECQTSAGTCCAGPNVCDSVPPCLGNPCCSS